MLWTLVQSQPKNSSNPGNENIINYLDAHITQIHLHKGFSTSSILIFVCANVIHVVQRIRRWLWLLRGDPDMTA